MIHCRVDKVFNIALYGQISNNSQSLVYKKMEKNDNKKTINFGKVKIRNCKTKNPMLFSEIIHYRATEGLQDTKKNLMKIEKQSKAHLSIHGTY